MTDFWIGMNSRRSLGLIFLWRLQLMCWAVKDFELGRGPWVWVGRVGVAFKRLWGFRYWGQNPHGIHLVQFGPLVVSWKRA